jgi:gas vesicle protein
MKEVFMLSGNRIGTSVKGFLIGGAVGSVITFLFTPKTGKELRKDIESGTKDYINKARTEGKKIVSSAKDIYNEILIKAEQLRTLTKKYAENTYTVPAKRIENEIISLRMAIKAVISVYNKTNGRTLETDKKVREIYSEFDNNLLPKFEGMGRRNNKN